ncbi:hypothetical protein [uncultured Ruminococcus sp.]|uniref:InlB B-repeat-containing protein n=1 Tax=uncultured Ruminococcus sp. TaxID=165186 RepID=UPI0025EFAE39|nr:hypothetical protein [uncultured Ruminococcus sp.]
MKGKIMKKVLAGVLALMMLSGGITLVPDKSMCSITAITASSAQRENYDNISFCIRESSDPEHRPETQPRVFDLDRVYAVGYPTDSSKGWLVGNTVNCDGKDMRGYIEFIAKDRRKISKVELQINYLSNDDIQTENGLYTNSPKGVTHYTKKKKITIDCGEEGMDSVCIAHASPEMDNYVCFSEATVYYVEGVPSEFYVNIPDNITGGTLTANKTAAVPGEKITLNVTPDEGYVLRTIYYDNQIMMSGSSVYSFIMPDKDVSVSAVFDKLVYIPPRDPTCTQEGSKGYWYDEETFSCYLDPNGKNKTDRSNVVIKPLGESNDSYSYPVFTFEKNEETGDYSAYATFTCEKCGEQKVVDATVNTNIIEPTYTNEGTAVCKATVVFKGMTYTVSKTFSIDKLEFTPPAVTYQKGERAVKLEWNAIEGVESYAVARERDGVWYIFNWGPETSIVINDLTPGAKYKFAVFAMLDGKWNTDTSNAITVSPNSPHAYPNVTSTEYSENTHQFRIKWDAVKGAEKYSIAVRSANKWSVQAYTDADTTTFTSPKLKAGQTYEIVVCAKVNGKWDISNIDSRAFKVTIK